MPNVNICAYLSDEEYVKYAKNKKEYNKKVRDVLKRLVK